MSMEISNSSVYKYLWAEGSFGIFGAFEGLLVLVLLGILRFGSPFLKLGRGILVIACTAALRTVAMSRSPDRSGTGEPPFHVLGKEADFSTHAATLDAIAMTHTLSHAIMCPTQPGRPVRRFKCWVTVTALSKYVGCDWAGKSRP